MIFPPSKMAVFSVPQFSAATLVNLASFLRILTLFFISFAAIASRSAYSSGPDCAYTNHII